MSDLLPFIVVGIAVGSVYALAGVGLVLTYKTSGIFNFAHGALATLGAYAFYTINVQHGVPWPIAFGVTLFVLGPILGILFESFAKGLSNVGVAWRIGATVGILLSIEALCTIIYGTSERTFPHFLPTSGFFVDGVMVTWEEVIVAVVPLVATVVLYIGFRVTRIGIAMRAVVEQPDLLALAGTSPRTVRRWAWIIGCGFATLSGLLLAPSVSLDPTTLTLLVVAAFGAAAIGNFSNLPMTWLGGILIGVVGSLATKYGNPGSIISGLPPSLPFVVLFLILVFAPRSRLGLRQVGVSVRAIEWRAPRRVQIVLGVLILTLLVLIPEFVGFRLNTFTLMLTSVLLFISLGLLVRVAGQVSLCLITFAAIGASQFSKLAYGDHIPWLAAVLVAGLIAVPIGALLAIPAIRFSGLVLGLATLGFGLMVQDMFYSSSWMFGFGGVGVQMPRPSLSWIDLSSDRGFYYVTLAITVLAALGVVGLVQTRFGRLLRGIADSPTAMQSSGNGTQVALVMVFCISAFLAAIAGQLQGMVYHEVGGVNFDPIVSVLYLAVILLSVGTTPWYAILPAASLVLLPLYITSPKTTDYLQLTFGVAAVSVALGGQRSLPGAARIRAWFDHVGGRAPLQARYRGSQATIPAAEDRRARPITVEVRNLTVQFGGLVAVRSMSLRADPGRVVGLIGPNGAGKTTTLNAISGLVPPTTGDVRLNGQDVRRQSPATRARYGLGRTYQQMELCESLSVWDNVALGREGGLAGASIVRQIVPTAGDRITLADATARALDRTGLTGLADVQVGSLSSSERRFVEIARCLAGPFSFLLLDEPSSGLDAPATERLGGVIRALVDEDNVGVLLVEHDMSLAMSICDEIYVMDFGGPIFFGTPHEVQESSVVRAAYLGSEGTEPSLVHTDAAGAAEGSE